MLEQRNPGGAERGSYRDVEATITVQDRRIVSVELQPLFVNDEHRDASAVLARVKDLLGFVIVRPVAGNLRRPEHARPARRDVVFVDRRRDIEGVERVENELVIVLAMKSGCGARARQSDFVFQLS